MSGTRPYDAVLLIAFGGPTRIEEVRPFLDHVVRGRAIPRERLEEVVHHYELIGGCSPLTQLTMRQAQALRAVLAAEGPALPVFVGMRNWHPFLRDTLAEMRSSGLRRAVGFILSAQQSEAGWERYQLNVADACAAIGPDAPTVEYTREWHAHPLFVEAVAARVHDALQRVPRELHSALHTVFTAHSIPVTMAERSPYVRQLLDGVHLVAKRARLHAYSLAYQSRSGSPREPWLEPDIGDVVRRHAASGTRTLLVVPIGFVCDHVEVLYDLDIEAKQIADRLGLCLIRAQAVNDHPAFIRMMADVIRTHVSNG